MLYNCIATWKKIAEDVNSRDQVSRSQYVKEQQLAVKGGCVIGPGNEVLLQRVWFSVRLLVSHGRKRGCYVRAEGGEFTRSIVPFQNELPLFALSCHLLDKMNKPRTASSLLSFFFLCEQL